MRQYRQKTVVITGACGRIGRALAARFGEAGARIVLIDIRKDELAALVEYLQTKTFQAEGFYCDVSDNIQVEKVFSRIINTFATIDVLINGASLIHNARFEQTELTAIERMMRVNFYGALYCTRAALPKLCASQGQIISMTNISGFPPLWYLSAYTASKQALHGLLDSLRLELAESNVTITLVCPGFMATDKRKHALQADGSVVINNGEISAKATSPNEIAGEIFESARRDKPLVLISNVDRLTRLIAQLVPSFFQRHIAHRVEGIE